MNIVDASRVVGLLFIAGGESPLPVAPRPISSGSRAMRRTASREAVLIFGESAADEAYHLPESLADIEIWCRTPDGERAELKTEKVENDDRVGLVAPLAELPSCRQCSRSDARVRRLRRLPAHLLREAHPRRERTTSWPPPVRRPSSSSTSCRKATADGLELTVLWDGKPKADVDVNVKVDGENEDVEAQKCKTDADGKVTLKPEGAGLVAVLANFYDKTKSGELDGKKYTSVAHYATLTFPVAAASRDRKAAEPDRSSRLRSRSGIAAAARAGLQLRRGRVRTVGCTSTAATPAPSTTTRPRICRSTSAACGSKVARQWEATADADAAARPRRWWPTAASSIASAA